MAEDAVGAEARLELVEYGTCPKCGYLTLPVLEMSPCGHDDAPILAELAEPGTVYSWTKVARSGGSQVLAMADFFDGRLRVTAPVLDPGDIAIGDSVVAIAGSETPYGFTRSDRAAQP